MARYNKWERENGQATRNTTTLSIIHESGSQDVICRSDRGDDADWHDDRGKYGLRDNGRYLSGRGASTMNKMSREQLLSLPERGWDKDTDRLWRSIIIFPTFEEHDRGWNCMAIIGCGKVEPEQVLTTCSDDIGWMLPNNIPKYFLRNDCCLVSGGMHFWLPSGWSFRVGCALSSINIGLVKEHQQ